MGTGWLPVRDRVESLVKSAEAGRDYFRPPRLAGLVGAEVTSVRRNRPGRALPPDPDGRARSRLPGPRVGSTAPARRLTQLPQLGAGGGEEDRGAHRHEVRGDRRGVAEARVHDGPHGRPVALPDLVVPGRRIG